MSPEDQTERNKAPQRLQFSTWSRTGVKYRVRAVGGNDFKVSKVDWLLLDHCFWFEPAVLQLLWQEMSSVFRPADNSFPLETRLKSLLSVCSAGREIHG